MEIVDYYYKLLGINHTASRDEIVDACNQKFKKFENLPFLNNSQKNEKNELRKARYLLLNQELKSIYDSIILKQLDDINKIKEHEKMNTRKERIDSNLMGDRIFSMIGILNPPQQNIGMDRQFINYK
jgi:hypothetical protein